MTVKSWTPPKTYAVGDADTAQDANTYGRDNSQFLHDPPAARVYNSGALVIPSGASTALSFDSERFDNDTMHSTSSNTSRLTIVTAGKYVIGGCVSWAASSGASNSYILSLRLNGATTIVQKRQAGGSSSVAIEMEISTLYSFAANDYVELMVFQNTGGNLNVNALSSYSPEFWATWVGGTV